MNKPKFIMELDRQKESRPFDLQMLAFALIEEASESEGISSESFLNLLELFQDREVLSSGSFHSLTTAIWSDPETLSKDQYAEFGNRIGSMDFDCISKMNAYSLCDMVSNTFEKRQAIAILKSLAAQKPLTEAASYSISEIS